MDLRIRSRVVADTNSIASLSFVKPSRREAVFVVSPIAVYSTRSAEPTFPAITGPLFSPTPISKLCSKPCSPSHALKRSRRGPIISRAAV